MRVLKHRNLLGCLFAFILAMPLINIGVRCAYTVFNKNAKDSYSNNISFDEYFNDEEKTVTIPLKYNNEKLLYTTNFLMNNSSQISSIMTIWKYQNYTYTYNNLSTNVITYFTTGNPNLYWVILSSGYNGFSYGDRYINIDGVRYFLSDDLTLKISDVYYENFKEKVLYDFNSYELNNNKLDNAFSYSVSQVTEGNNIGELKFFTWFADLFLDLDNSNNALYVNFINWYFNYALLVSAVYILFLALMWFIMWVRRLLERGMDFGNRSW